MLAAGPLARSRTSRALPSTGRPTLPRDWEPQEICSWGLFLGPKKYLLLEKILTVADPQELFLRV
jgi:hypothetical protein